MTTNNCYNCENLTIVRQEDYMGYEVWYNTDCKHCDMRIKNHAIPCEKHKVGEPTMIYRKQKGD